MNERTNIKPGVFFIYQILLIALLAVVLSVIIAKGGMVGLGGLIALPIVIIFVRAVFKNPRFGLYTVLHYGFFCNGITRYVDAQVGLGVDAILLLTLLAAFNKSSHRQNIYMKNPFTYGMALWTMYTIFEIVNPEARSSAAWFFAVRGTSLYMLQIIIIASMLMNDPKELGKFLKIWTIWSVIACCWAMKQLYLGLNSAEQRWMDAGAYKTHLLFGKLRAFSFYSDAGQFGASMAHILLICIILATGPFGKAKKLKYWGFAIVFFWGMAISGTRGAMFVPLSGIMLFLFLSKNFKVLALGGGIMGIAFGLLKFTTVGAGNYQIARMRSGLDPNDPSLQVRLENQRKLAAYLASRPLGGGIGSAGYWGTKFTPGTFLAETPTDSWYVRIWVEAGIVGLYVHLAMVIGFIVAGCVMVWRMKDPVAQKVASALICGFFGIATASYGNQVMGQTPTIVTTFISLPLVFLIYRWDKAGKTIDLKYL